METAIGIFPIPFPTHSLKSSFDKKSNFRSKGSESTRRVHVISHNGSFPLSDSNSAQLSSIRDMHRSKSSLESVFCYDKPIPEEIIEKPVGLSLFERRIGDSPCCSDCQAKGAVLCTTCSGSGLYVDSILESQGIIVKVRCLGCGGTGNIMCWNVEGEVIFELNDVYSISDSAFLLLKFGCRRSK